MRKIIVLALFLSVLAISACHHSSSTTGTLRLNYKAIFGSNNLRLNTQYQTPDNKYFNFQDYKLFLSHIKLIHTDGSSVEVSPLIFISLDDSSTLTIPISCPVGSYKGIQFSIGLDSVQNDQPASSDPANPQYVDHNMNWSTSLKYVFVFIDGLAGSSGPTDPMVYHVGTQPYYTSGPVLSRAFSISGGGQTVLTLNTDLQKVFYNTTGTGTINVLTDPVTQTTESTYAGALARTFINDFSQTFSLQ